MTLDRGVPCAYGWMSVPLRAMLFREPKVTLPKAFSRMQSLQGAPVSKNRRPVGLILMYLPCRVTPQLDSLETHWVVAGMGASCQASPSQRQAPLGMDANAGFAWKGHCQSVKLWITCCHDA